jgi:hypothetical protein
MNDPRILNDREIMEAPECIREIHAIRLKIQEEYDVFSSDYADHCHKTTEVFFAGSSVTPHYADLAEQGRVSHPKN